MNKRASYSLLFLLCCTGFPVWSMPPAEVVRYETDNIELNAHCRIGDSSYAVVFLPTMFDAIQRQYDSMVVLAKQGVTSCFLDFFADMFLPQSNSTFDKIPVDALAGLLNATARQLNKRAYLSASGRGAQLAARTTLYAMRHNLEHPPGLLLFSPNFLDGTPAAGAGFTYISRIHEQNRPVFLFQPQYSPHYWHLQTLLKTLKKSKTPIYYQVLDQVRDGYRLREDQTATEITLTARTGKLLLDAIKKIEQPG